MRQRPLAVVKSLTDPFRALGMKSIHRSSSLIQTPTLLLLIALSRQQIIRRPRHVPPRWPPSRINRMRRHCRLLRMRILPDAPERPHRHHAQNPTPSPFRA